MNSTNTSSISTVSTNYRQKGKLPSSQSKIYKGFIHDATSKLSVGSIPAKFETIVYRNQSQKAFGSSNPRFQADINDTPGPQEYDFPQQYAITLNKAPESFSKKGYGGFITTEERQVFRQKYLNNGPGPGNYEEASFFKDSSSMSRVTNKSAIIKTSIKRLPSSQDPRVKIVYPGPGEYEGNMPRSLNTYQSSFVSKTRRDDYMKLPEAPAPGQYNIKRNLLIKRPQNLGPSSSFHPTQDHKKQQTTQERLMNFLEDPVEKEARVQSPGPCDYDIKVPNFIESPDQIETSAFRLQNKDRFGDPVDKSRIQKDNLGPGLYELKGQLETIAEEKVLVSGAAFMSETLRKPYGDFQDKLGPNTTVAYMQPRKKDFHLNLKRKWV